MLLTTKRMLFYLNRLKSLSKDGIKATGKFWKIKKAVNKRNNMEGMQGRFQTFVFLDLETTGLLQSGRTPPRITEIGMVAVMRDCFYGDGHPLHSRVKYKLVVPLNPMEDITRQVEALTGLCNKHMRQLRPFTTNTKLLLNTFLQQLRGPICFVAHNGNRFDYPIFLSELEKIGPLEDEDSLYTIDSLEFFKYYFRSRKNQVNPNTDSLDANILLDDGWDKELSDMLDEYTPLSSKMIHTIQPEILDCPVAASVSDISPNPSEPRNYCAEMQLANEKTPENQMIRSKLLRTPLQAGDCTTARRQLDFRSPLQNHKLGTIYEHIFGTKSCDNHTAEGDCLTLLECVFKTGNCFVEWADDHAVRLYPQRC